MLDATKSCPQLCDQNYQFTIDGSTDRCGIAIVTNQRALLSGSDQPERKLGSLCILCVRWENKLAKTATFAQWYMVHCIIRNGYELNNNKGKTD